MFNSIQYTSPLSLGTAEVRGYTSKRDMSHTDVTTEHKKVVAGARSVSHEKCIDNDTRHRDLRLGPIRFRNTRSEKQLRLKECLLFSGPFDHWRPFPRQYAT